MRAAVKVQSWIPFLGLAVFIGIPVLLFYNYPWNDPLIYIIGLFLFSFVGLWLFLYSGEVIANEKGIGYRNRFGAYFIEWNEVDSVEDGAGNLVIGNHEKRITMMDIHCWGFRGRAEVLQYLKSHMRSKNLKVRSTSRAVFAFPKNTKIRNFSKIQHHGYGR